MEILICILLGGFVVATGIFFVVFSKNQFNKMNGGRKV